MAAKAVWSTARGGSLLVGHAWAGPRGHAPGWLGHLCGENMPLYCYNTEGSKEFDHYEVAMVSQHITVNLPIHIFVYAYTKLGMLQFGYDLMGKYMDHRCWKPLYTDTDSYYMAFASDSLLDCMRLDHKWTYYNFYNWFPSEACDEHKAEFMTIWSPNLGTKCGLPKKAHHWERHTHAAFPLLHDG